MAKSVDVMDHLTEAEKAEMRGKAEAALQEAEKKPVNERIKIFQNIYERSGYFVDKSGCLCKLKQTKDGTETVQLANFAARIIREVVRDDGGEVRAEFVIDGVLAGGRTLPEIHVPTSKFTSLTWPVDRWGAAANISPGVAMKDSLRHAIQKTGFGCERETIYGHTGWREINGQWAYLHAGGAIGAERVKVDLDAGKIGMYALPAVTNPTAAARLTLQCLELAPREITIPLLATVFLAPLCEPLRSANIEPGFLVWLAGPTGARKSTLAGLLLSHFGDFSAKGLPGNFKDSENSLERRAFLLKDTLFVVDDFHPVGSPLEKKLVEKKAHALMRGYGDRTGRSRLNADTSVKETYVPRGLCLVTGEDVPALGQSAMARILTLELTRNQLDLTLLSTLQARQECLGETMAGFLSYIAPQIPAMPKQLKSTFNELRIKVNSQEHGRMSEVVAHLFIGFSAMLSYFAELQVISRDEHLCLSDEAWEVLLGLSEEQGRRIQDEAPERHFITALRELLLSGQVTVHSHTEAATGDDGRRRHIGWETNEQYWLLPETAYKEVHQYYLNQGRTLSIGVKQLWKHMESAALIITEPDSRTPKRWLPGLRQQKRVLVIPKIKFAEIEKL